MNSNDLTIAQQTQFDLVSFRVSWAQAVLFGCYEVRLYILHFYLFMNNFSSLQVTASFLLVIIGMIYYKAPEDGMVTECGSLLPDWKSVSAIFSLYTIVFILMFLANVWFIQHTRRQAATEVPTWVIFTHPALRLVLCK